MAGHTGARRPSVGGQGAGPIAGRTRKGHPAARTRFVTVELRTTTELALGIAQTGAANRLSHEITPPPADRTCRQGHSRRGPVMAAQGDRQSARSWSVTAIREISGKGNGLDDRRSSATPGMEGAASLTHRRNDRGLLGGLQPRCLARIEAGSAQSPAGTQTVGQPIGTDHPGTACAGGFIPPALVWTG